MVSTYTARSEPDDSTVVMHYCANCGVSMLRPAYSLPEICPQCQDLTTWLSHVPRHVRWRIVRQQASHPGQTR
ncbi:hypothetical protein ACFLYO_11480 [Chloroflexota bacterium]